MRFPTVPEQVRSGVQVAVPSSWASQGLPPASARSDSRRFSFQDVEGKTAKLSQVAGGGATLGESWKSKLDGSEEFKDITKLAEEEETVCRCYGEAIRTRSAALMKVARERTARPR